MTFTITSRGVAIGSTDLAFYRVGGRNRSGWFYPNAEGEKAMELIASPIPAMRAYLLQDVLGEDSKSIVRPELIGSTLFADLAEAFQHNASLDLEVRNENGALIPTEMIGFQDAHTLGEIGRRIALSAELDAEADEETLSGFDIGEADEENVSGFDIGEPGARDGNAFVTIVHDTGEVEEWMPDDDELDFPRYQIHVMLVDDTSIP